MNFTWNEKMISLYVVGCNFLDKNKESQWREEGVDVDINFHEDISPEDVKNAVCFDFVQKLELLNEPPALRSRLASRLLIWAAFRGHEDIVNLLHDQHLLVLESKDVLGNTALHLSAYLNFPKITKRLLLAGADKEAVNKDGQTPLLLGAKGGLLESVQLLIDAGCKLDVKDHDQCTPLLLAVGANSIAVVKALLKKNVNCFARDVKGFNPLHFAAQNGNAEILKVLLKTQIEVETKDKKGCTPLHYAVKYGHAAAVQVLLEAGADTTIKNKKGETAADLASSYFVKQLL